MKSALILLISSFFLIGVFGESVSVMEGSSVTLHTDLTEIQRTDTVEWRFIRERIAKISRDSNGAISVWVSPDGPFRDRLQLNNQTGDLKITAFSNTDSGQYTLKIKSTRGSSEKTFSVNGVNSDEDPMTKVPGTVGEFVILKTIIQSNEVIQWRFGPQNTVIAELNLPADSFSISNDVLDGKFRDRLMVDKQTGYLNITDTRTTDSGVYEAQIRGSGYTIHKTFNVTVTDVKSMSVKEGEYVPLHTGLTHIQRNDVILWRFGDKGIIAHLNGPDVKSGWSNFQLSERTGDLTISNIQRNQSGDYKVEFNTTNIISQRKYNIIISGAFGESVSVMEGSSVTLHTDLTEIQRTDTVEWRFIRERIAKISWNSIGAISAQVSTDGPFRGRLQLNNQTGDLKITSFSNTDSGQYILKFRSTRGSSEKTFNVNGVNADKDPVKKVLGTVGGFVTLKTEKQSDEVMKWRFGPQNTLIAKVGVLATDYLDGTFKGRLELDDDTGSLTITDIRTTDSGEYEAGIRRSGSGYTIHETFSVTVTDVKSMSVKEGDSVTLHTNLTQIQRNDVILWRFEDIIIASLNGPDVESGWINFQLSERTGDLTISNIQRDQFGDYKVEINTISMISHRKYNISDSGLSPAAPDSGLSPGAVAGIVVAVLLVFAAVGVIYYRRKCSKTETHSEVNGQNHTSNKDEETELTKPAEAAE